MAMEVRGKIAGIPASEGFAVGPVFVHAPEDLSPERESIPQGDVEGEISRFRAAVEAVLPKLSETRDKLHEAGNEDEAAIFDAHIELA